MTNDQETRPVQQSGTPASVFGTEQRFQAMADEEVAAVASSSGILDFLNKRKEELAQGVGGAALQWVSGEVLRAFGLGIGGDLDKIKEVLNQVLWTQQQILMALGELLREVQFQALITRGYESVERITGIYKRLRNLANTGKPEDPGNQEEAKLLKTAILDPDNGVGVGLQTITDVLLDQGALESETPLIPLFAARWLPAFLKKQLEPEVPLSLYPGQLEAWLHGLFIVQYLGLAELASARVANGQFGLLKEELEQTIGELVKQRALLDQAIPEFTRTQPEALFDGRRYVVRSLDDSRVMYGSPVYNDLSVQFRNRHEGNEDEEWRFEKTGESDTFIMRELSGPAYVTLEKSLPLGVAVKVGDRSKAVKMKLVLGQNPKAAPDAKPRDQFLPIFGFVGRTEYMSLEKYRDGDHSFAKLGPENEAVHLQIVYAGHDR